MKIVLEELGVQATMIFWCDQAGANYFTECQDQHSPTVWRISLGAQVCGPHSSRETRSLWE